MGSFRRKEYGCGVNVKVCTKEACEKDDVKSINLMRFIQSFYFCIVTTSTRKKEDVTSVTAVDNRKTVSKPCESLN